ncbi:pseudouridylate synthase [Acinetobacter sp. ANC 4558]|uniref:pseudouridine synthase n=1 Tax=Acinetobacter sp. ANC 4558 TaxID=1977876 RepID=UPI000A356635|nr:pseudouridine synthase [Acinetobacter sp. ANC 4558]OTG86068.1 pseudouridylate synthase [Acinetobacter sp. ANC 4558]
MNIKSEFLPPMINGVSASKLYLPEIFLQPTTTIFEYLCLQFTHISQHEWAQRFNEQLIFNDAGQILTTQSLYTANIHIFYYRFLSNEIHVPFQHIILFENDELIVVDKPHFLTMTPTGQYVQETLLVRLKQQTQNEHLTPIHRLDRETAGVVLFSKRPKTRGQYQQLFAERKVQKTYHAIAPFNPALKFPQQLSLRMEKGEPFYTMQVSEGISNSTTRISILEHNDQWAKYLLQPLTGKQHQLRVHLNHLGLAIQNDSFYPKVVHHSDHDFSAPLQLLAKKIEFQDPIHQKYLSFSSQQELTLS